jgi:DNA-binding transcriptional ArsR family regulator
MSLKTLLDEARRLAILQLLAQDGDEAINDSVMASALAALGHGVRREVVRADFLMLADLDLLALEDLGGTILARLTDQGAEVAAGRASAPGVKRHRPG